MLNGMPSTVFWAVAAVILGVIEAAVSGVVTIWFALGALLAFFAALLGVPFHFQVIIFIISSGVLLYFTRPIIKKYLVRKTERTNADRLIGQQGIVMERIDSLNGKGQVKVAGQMWSARSADGSDIEGDEKVEIQEIAGVKLIVKRLEE